MISNCDMICDIRGSDHFYTIILIFIKNRFNWL